MRDGGVMRSGTGGAVGGHERRRTRWPMGLGAVGGAPAGVRGGAAAGGRGVMEALSLAVEEGRWGGDER